MDQATDVPSFKLANASISSARMQQRQSAYDYLTRISYFNYLTLPTPAGVRYSDTVEVPFVEVIGEIFKVPPEEVQNDVLALTGSLTIMDYVDDLKQLLTSLGPTNSSLVKEFASEEEYKIWKGFEISEINQLILGLIDNTISELPQSEFGVSHHLVYIPPDPPAYYYSLLKLCMVRDIPLLQAKFKSHPELEDPLCRRSVPVLAKDSQDLFNSLYVSWRISRSTREVLLLKSATDLFECGYISVGMLCNVVRFINFYPRKSFVAAEEPWKLKDKRLYINCLKTIHLYLTRSMMRKLSTLWDREKVDLGHMTAAMEFYLYQDLLFAESGINFQTTVNWFRDSLKKYIQDRFSDEIKEISQSPSWPDMLLFISVLHKIFIRLCSVAQLCNIPKHFANVDISKWNAALNIDKIVADGVVEAASTAAWDVYEKIVCGSDTRRPVLRLDDVTKLKEALNGLHYWGKITDGHSDTDFERKLCTYIEKYFDAPDMQFIDGIINEDKFSWSEQQRHSSSAVRIMGLFSQYQQFITDLHLHNTKYKQRLIQSALKSIAEIIPAYVSRLKVSFCTDLGYSTNARRSITVVKTGENEWLQLYKIPEKTCVEMNYVTFLKEWLLELLDMMDDAAVVVDSTRLGELATYFAITVIEAHYLPVLDYDSSTSNVHVEINSQESRTTVNRTRPVSKSSKPQWTEKCGYATQKDTILEFLIRQQERDGTTSVLGKCVTHLRLDEEHMSPEFDLAVCPSGFLKLEIRKIQTMDSAISCYKNALSDLDYQESFMAEAITEKVSPIITFVLSTNNMQTMAEDNQQNSFDSMPFLLEYFEDNFDIMQRYLNPTMSTKVITNIWRACVSALLYLLSENPTRRRLDVINQWLQTLRRFFHGDGQRLSIGILESVDGFRELLRRIY
ncbi:hypothetical protein V1505DRAFT_371392 [Lipomyces doorenjongii]